VGAVGVTDRDVHLDDPAATNADRPGEPGRVGDTADVLREIGHGAHRTHCVRAADGLFRQRSGNASVMTRGGISTVDIAAYRVLAEALPHLVWFARSDGSVTFYNRRIEMYGGLDPRPGGVYEWSPIVHPDDLERTQAAWRRAVEHRTEYECEHRVRMVDGSYRLHLSRALPLDTGGPVMWFGTATDTQILADTRAWLAESQSRLETVFSGIDQAYCICELVVDDDGNPIDYRFLETNPQFEMTTGLRDPVGRTALELVPSLEASWVETYATVALDGVQLRFEQESKAMGRHFDVFAMPIAPRGRFAVVFTDITERRAALEALQESERRFRNMADHTPVMIWVTDADGECTYLNRRWYEFTGQSEQEALGRGWLEAAHPDDRPATSLTFADATRRQAAFNIDYRLRHHDGTYRWAVDAAAPRFSGDGRFLGFVGSVMDITARKDAERAVAAERDREREVALRLQQSMLSAAPVEDARLELATAYVAGADMLRVGGDWYETFHLADGRVAVVVGDVVGHNAEAAAAMGQLRAGLLALTPYVDSPDALLCELDRFAQRHEITDFATAVCIFLDPDSGGIEYSSAGHPPALVCPPNGPVRWLDGARSLPLGVLPVNERPVATESLEPGAVLVAYSDGLIERRGEVIDVGFRRLAEVVEPHRHDSVRDLCSRILATLAGPTVREDDTVLVVLRRV
jgi:PAS domain S-box-containing protein